MRCGVSDPQLKPSKMSLYGLFSRIAALVLSGAFFGGVVALLTCTYTYAPGVSPSFPNDTQVCCGECRFTDVPKNCTRPAVMIVLVLCSIWVGAVLAFLFDRIFGSPLPGSLGVNCRRSLYTCVPCVVGFCYPEEALLEVSTPASRFQRSGVATVEEQFAADGMDGSDYFFDEEYDEICGRRWRRALEVGSHDGIDETCRANVTVHSF